MSLTVEDFPSYFEEVHGCKPFPWQEKLLRQVAEQGWPKVLDLPTGFGKTAALDIAVFHLAMEADKGDHRKAPVRIALVVDRRLVVDDAFHRACKIADAVNTPTGRVTRIVAQALRQLSNNDSFALLARRLRGGMPREDDWARTPSQPTILCSTVDQVGSRLLFRGYGISDSMKPVHAGLLGSDCLILLDEAHLSQPFQTTLESVARYRSEAWSEYKATAPWDTALLTATPRQQALVAFAPSEQDFAHPLLSERWKVSKRALLVEAKNVRTKSEGEGGADEEESQESSYASESSRVSLLAEQTLRCLKQLQEEGLPKAAIGVIVNRVPRARKVFEFLRERLGNEADTVLLIGPSRDIDREELISLLDPIRTGAERNLDQPRIVVATQCLEAGVDVDFDGLVTEIAPLDALRQRFGRLNRNGRPTPCFAVIVGGKADAKDPIYGEASWKTWEYLTKHPDAEATKAQEAQVDFGLEAFSRRLKSPACQEALPLMLVETEEAPTLMPAHLDLFTQTSPVPNADPEVSLFLHGIKESSETVSVVWRADISNLARNTASKADICQILSLVPPRSAEAIELPLWTARRWLSGSRVAQQVLADIPVNPPLEGTARKKLPAFRWTADPESSNWIWPNEIRAGDTLVVPTTYGGVDDFGWNPEYKEAVTDVALRASLPYCERRFALRVTPELLETEESGDALSRIISERSALSNEELINSISRLSDAPLQTGLSLLLAAKGARGAKLKIFDDLYDCLPDQQKEKNRGILFYAPLGVHKPVQMQANADSLIASSEAVTEDDEEGSMPGYSQLLKEHLHQVGEQAEKFAQTAGLPEKRILDLKLAGFLHDAGKADPRFQSLLAYGDPFAGIADAESVLAKSDRQAPRGAWQRAGLPEHWRHEALSVRLAPLLKEFAQAEDPELVLWLIGTHHGRGRPLFPHCDPKDQEQRVGLTRVFGMDLPLEAGPGPQSLAFSSPSGADWPTLFERLKTRYGAWELARMEAILRLADHSVSARGKLAAQQEKGIA